MEKNGFWEWLVRRPAYYVVVILFILINIENYFLDIGISRKLGNFVGQILFPAFCFWIYWKIKNRKKKQ